MVIYSIVFNCPCFKISLLLLFECFTKQCYFRLILFARDSNCNASLQESHHSGNNEITLRRYKDVLAKVIVLIDSEINSHKRMSKLTTKYAFIIDQVTVFMQ